MRCECGKSGELHVALEAGGQKSVKLNAARGCEAGAGAGQIRTVVAGMRDQLKGAFRHVVEKGSDG